MLDQKGKEMYGPKFRIHPEDYEIIFKLIVYMTKDIPNAKRYEVDLHKGILLAGPVGCGKTTLMTLVNYFQPQSQQYVVRPCRDISYEFIKDGYDVIHKYSKNSFIRRREEYIPRTYCFDDLGTEQSLKYYGNEATNVMGEILLTRYEMFVNKGMLTHITTNLSAYELESAYGNRMRSRMRAMFNLIAFENNIKDKRC